MAKQVKTATEEHEAEMPDVRTPEDSQLATIDQGTLADAAETVNATATYNNDAMQTFMNWLTERADGGDEDTYAVMASIMGEIMAAESVAEAMAEQSTLSAKDIVGRPLLLHGFEIRAGDHEDSLVQHYASMTVSAPGAAKTRILTCGALKVLMRLYKLDEFGEWPVPIMFTSKVGKKGTILDMVSP